MKMKYVARLETVSVSVSCSSEGFPTMRSTSVVGSVFYCRGASQAGVSKQTKRKPKKKRRLDVRRCRELHPNLPIFQSFAS